MTLFKAFEGYTPPTDNANDGSSYSLGLEFYVTAAVSVTAMRVFCPLGSTGTRTPRLWGVSPSSLLATGPAVASTPGAWLELPLSAPVALTVNKRYVGAVVIPNSGQYAATSQFFAADQPGGAGITNGPLYIPSASEGTVVAGGQALYVTGTASSMPNQSYNNTNYWIGPIVSDSVAAYKSGQFLPFF